MNDKTPETARPKYADDRAPESDGTSENRSEKTLSPAARRALADAEARRKQAEADKAEAEREVGGRGGKDPARYGDWEINGRAIDF
jgi:hypothetical protein